MPIYEYACGACGKEHEFIQKFSEGPKRKCPSCGALRLRKKVSAAAFHLKGTGWYATDFRDKGKAKKDGGKASESKDAKSESKTEAKSESKSGGKSESSSGSSKSSGASASAD